MPTFSPYTPHAIITSLVSPLPLYLSCYQTQCGSSMLPKIYRKTLKDNELCQLQTVCIKFTQHILKSLEKLISHLSVRQSAQFPAVFTSISFYFLLILKSISVPPEVPQWKSQKHASMWKVQRASESSHSERNNAPNKLMRSVGGDYLQRVRKGVWTKKQSQRPSFRWEIGKIFPKPPPSVCVDGCNEVISGRWISINLHPAL